MTTTEQIKILCVRMGISVAELARKLGQSPQNFNAKLKRETITGEELMQIANKLGIQYKQSFILPNGEKIEICNRLEGKE